MRPYPTSLDSDKAPLPIPKSTDSKGIENLKYDADADQRSWRDMRELFAELFATE